MNAEVFDTLVTYQIFDASFAYLGKVLSSASIDQPHAWNRNEREATQYRNFQTVPPCLVRDVSKRLMAREGDSAARSNDCRPSNCYRALARSQRKT